MDLWNDIKDRLPARLAVEAWCDRFGLQPEHLGFVVTEEDVTAVVTLDALKDLATWSKVQLVSLTWQKVKPGQTERVLYNLKAIDEHGTENGIGGYVAMRGGRSKELYEREAYASIARIMCSAVGIEFQVGCFRLDETRSHDPDSEVFDSTAVLAAAGELVVEEPAPTNGRAPEISVEVSSPSTDALDERTPIVATRVVSPQVVEEKRGGSQGRIAIHQRELDRVIKDANLYPTSRGLALVSKVNLIRAYTDRRRLIMETVMRAQGIDDAGASARIAQRRVSFLVTQVVQATGKFGGDTWADDAITAYLHRGLQVIGVLVPEGAAS